MRSYNTRRKQMAENTETVQTVDLTAKAKEAAVWGAVSAVSSIAVTLIATAVVNKVLARRTNNNVIETVAEEA
jgi:hypothetical protein